jgi:hypothetical protein
VNMDGPQIGVGFPTPDRSTDRPAQHAPCNVQAEETFVAFYRDFVPRLVRFLRWQGVPLTEADAGHSQRADNNARSAAAQRHGHAGFATESQDQTPQHSRESRGWGARPTAPLMLMTDRSRPPRRTGGTHRVPRFWLYGSRDQSVG